MSNRVIDTMEQLKDMAIRLNDGMWIYYPQFNQKVDLQINETCQEHSGQYAYNNSVVAFVEDNIMYVIPDIKGVQKTLSENGFPKSYFYVPCSNWDYPIAYEKEWKDLWNIKNTK